MSMAKGVDGDNLRENRDILAARIIDVAAAAMGEDNGWRLYVGIRN